MSLPSNGSLALSDINRSVRFTNGNLGIGTTAPTRKLDIFDSTEAGINLQSTSAQTRILSFNDTVTYFQSSGDIAFTGIDTTTLRHLYLATNGNIGIGTTSPQVKLHVNGSSLFWDYMGANMFFNAGWTRGNASNLGFALRIGSTGDIYGNGLQTFMLDNGVLNTNLFMVGANGNVGIGTVTPAQRLEVAGGRIQVSNSSSAVYEMTNSAGTAFLFNNPSGSVHLTAPRNIILNADEGGNQFGTVGICTSNPNSSVRLHVNGDILLSTQGSLWIAGTEDQGTNRFRFHNSIAAGSYIDFVGGSLNIRSGITSLSTSMILTTAGNLGINATSSELLTIGGDTDLFGNAVRTSWGNNTPVALINLGTLGTRDSRRMGMILHDGTDLQFINQEPGYIDIATNNGATGQLRLHSTGNVSLGTTIPQGRLRVHASSFPNVTLTPGDEWFDNYVTQIQFDSASKTGGKLWRVMSTHGDASEGQGKFIITNATDARANLVLLPEVGRAGIGTVNPAPPNGLHIQSGEFQLGPNDWRAFHWHANGSGNLYYYSGSWGAGTQVGYWYNNGLVVSGAISKSSGTFDIQHPLHPDDTNNRLVHSFIEGPRCDLIYRGQVTLINGTATVNLDTDCVAEGGSEMSSGTFEALCTNPQFFLQNKNAFTGLKGNIQGNILTIQCENTNSTDTIYWTVIAERKDDQIKSWERTNTSGYLKTEYVSENRGGSIPVRS